MLPRRLFTVAVLASLVLVLGAAPPAFAAKDYRAERYDVTLTVEPGGSMLVTERVRFVFGDDSFTSVFRGLPKRRTDGITVLVAAMDGRPFVPGDDPGEFEIDDKDGKRRVVWHFSTVTASAHTFDLTYRVAGVVRYEAAEDLLEWNALPTSHAYPIECASLSLTVPAGATLLASPSVEPGPTEVSAADGLRFSRCGFGKDDSWLLRARFSPRSVVTAQTDWQRRAARAARTMPLFLGLGAMILFAGAGGFIVFALNHRSPTRPDREQTQPAAPDNLPANLGAALARRGTPSWADALATIMDMAARDVVRIEEIPGGNVFRKRDFAIAPHGPASALRPSERVLHDLLFTTKSGPRASVTFSELGKVFGATSRWKAYAKAVEAEVRQHGFYDREREQTRNRVTMTGIVGIVCGFVGLIAAVPFIQEFGGASLAIGVSLLAVGITGVGVGQSLTPLTDDAERRSGAWQAYGRYLKELATAPATTSRSEFSKALPFAVAFGAGLAWAKALEKRGLTTGPHWLRVLPHEGAGSGHMAATIAMLSSGNAASESVGHAAAGVGAAGAAGGGTSGAH